MLVYSEKTVKITIEMNEREARWLKGNMQNPVLNDGEYEGKKEMQMRENLFNHLREEIGD